MRDRRQLAPRATGALTNSLYGLVLFGAVVPSTIPMVDLQSILSKYDAKDVNSSFDPRKRQLVSVLDGRIQTVQ